MMIKSKKLILFF